MIKLKKQFNNDAKETYELVQNVKFCKVIYDNYIKGSIEEELADVVIRCLDLAGLRLGFARHVG